DVLVDGATVALDFARQRGEEGGQDAAQLLGVEPLAERRRAREVSEEDRDQSAVLTQIDARTAGDLERRPARGVSNRGRCSRCGSALDRRTAVGTEPVRRPQDAAARRTAQPRTRGRARPPLSHWPSMVNGQYDDLMGSAELCDLLQRNRARAGVD